MSITQGILPFKLIVEKSSEVITSFAGLPLVLETMKAMKIPELVRKNLKIKQRDSGKYSEGDYVESFLSLFVSGGECLDDMERLRADEGLKKLGLSVPSSESARFFLYEFHNEEMLKEGRPSKGAFVPEETPQLKGLMKVNKAYILRATKRQSPTIATIDQDPTVIPSNKTEAMPTYRGHDGYQPIINYWAEEELILADEFRDGNVPASYDCYTSLYRSVEMMPDSVREVRYRADSAACEYEFIEELQKGFKVRGRHIRVYYAISVDRTDALKREIEELPESAWRPLRKITEEGLEEGRKEWAEVEYIPSKGKGTYRYLVIRVRPLQGELFADGNRYHYHAVVTNMWHWDGERLLRWHRERCGTVEKVHDVLKNDLAGGVMPCGRFYANAAWWRLNCLAYNIISVMKRRALPERWWSYRMKAMRYWLIAVAGKIIRTGRQIYLRFYGTKEVCALYCQARRKLYELALVT
jgi:hypothetical protein